MKIYKISFRNSVNILAQNIARKLFEYMRDNNYSPKTYDLNDFPLKITNDIKNMGITSININVLSKKSNEPIDSKDNFFSIFGDASKINDNPIKSIIHINITIFYDIFNNKNSYQTNKLYTSSVNTILHELTHCVDFNSQDPTYIQQNSTADIEDSINFAEKYFTDKLENNSFVEGMLLEARKIHNKNNNDLIETVKNLMENKIDLIILSDRKNLRTFNVKKLNSNDNLKNHYFDIKEKIMTIFMNRLTERHPTVKQEQWN